MRPTPDSSNYLSDLNDTFSLTNLVVDFTCFKSNKGILIYFMLTSSPSSFYKSHGFVAVLSNWYKLAVSILRTWFHRNLYEDVIRDEKVPAEPFHETYINIVDISSGNKPSSSGWKIMQRKMPLLTKLHQNTVLIPVSKNQKGIFSK